MTWVRDHDPSIIPQGHKLFDKSNNIYYVPSFTRYKTAQENKSPVPLFRYGWLIVELTMRRPIVTGLLREPCSRS